MANTPQQNQPSGRGQELAKALAMKLLERATAPKASATQAPSGRSGYREVKDRHDTSPKWGKDEKVSPPRGLSTSRVLELRDNGDRFSLHGTSYHSHTIKYLLEHAADENGDIQMILLPEPQNPHDKNAVVVAVPYNGKYHKIGYVPADDAARYSKALAPIVKKKLLPIAMGRLSVHDQARAHLKLGSPATILPASFKS